MAGVQPVLASPTGLIRRCSVPVLLLSPLLPQEVEAADADLRGQKEWALLDCAPGEQAHACGREGGVKPGSRTRSMMLSRPDVPSRRCSGPI